MATIMDLGDGRLIASDPAETLGHDEDWCAYCAGSRLEEYDEGAPTVCGTCTGTGVVPCTDPIECHRHGRAPRLLILLRRLSDQRDRLLARRDRSVLDEFWRLMQRHDSVWAAYETAIAERQQARERRLRKAVA